jgi:hypothetical protein
MNRIPTTVGNSNTTERNIVRVNYSNKDYNSAF